jgi:hypothetical protein
MPWGNVILILKSAQVFRELLQNSDDAQSKTVEIHFETRDFVDKRNGKLLAQNDLENSKVTIPDLKSTIVRYCQILM